MLAHVTLITVRYRQQLLSWFLIYTHLYDPSFHFCHLEVKNAVDPFNA